MMAARLFTRVMVVIGALVAASAPRASLAATVPCFAERTVLRAAWLYDETETTRIGFLRAGAVVRLLDDPTDRLALVETRELGVRGRVKSRGLVVFAREDIPIVAGFSWWMKGHALNVLGEDGGQVEVQGTRPGGFKPSLTDCTKLQPEFDATLGTTLHIGTCDGGALTDDRRPAGTRVWRRDPESDLSIVDSSGKHREEGGSTWMMASSTIGQKKAAKLVAVEIIDAVHHVRLEGFVLRASLVTKARGAGAGISESCADWEWTRAKGQRAALTGSAKMRTAAGAGTVITELPAREVLVLETKDAWVRVQVGFPTLDPAVAQMVLCGWVKKAAVKVAAGGGEDKPK